MSFLWNAYGGAADWDSLWSLPEDVPPTANSVPTAPEPSSQQPAARGALGSSCAAGKGPAALAATAAAPPPSTAALPPAAPANSVSGRNGGGGSCAPGHGPGRSQNSCCDAPVTPAAVLASVTSSPLRNGPTTSWHDSASRAAAAVGRAAAAAVAAAAQPSETLQSPAAAPDRLCATASTDGSSTGGLSQAARLLAAEAADAAAANSRTAAASGADPATQQTLPPSAAMPAARAAPQQLQLQHKPPPQQPRQAAASLPLPQPARLAAPRSSLSRMLDNLRPRPSQVGQQQLGVARGRAPKPKAEAMPFHRFCADNDDDGCVVDEEWGGHAGRGLAKRLRYAPYGARPYARTTVRKPHKQPAALQQPTAQEPQPLPEPLPARKETDQEEEALPAATSEAAALGRQLPSPFKKQPPGTRPLPPIAAPAPLTSIRPSPFLLATAHLPQLPAASAAVQPQPLGSIAGSGDSSVTPQSSPMASPAKGLPSSPLDVMLRMAFHAWRTTRGRSDGERPEKVLRDHLLEELVTLRPTAILQLEAVQGLTRPWVRRYGQEVLDVVRNHLHLHANGKRPVARPLFPAAGRELPAEFRAGSSSGCGGSGAAGMGAADVLRTVGSGSSSASNIPAADAEGHGAAAGNTTAAAVAGTGAGSDSMADGEQPRQPRGPASPNPVLAAQRLGVPPFIDVHGVGTLGRDRWLYAPGEHDWILARWREGAALSDIAVVLQRSPNALRRRLCNLGYSVSNAENRRVGASGSGEGPTGTGGRKLQQQKRQSVAATVRDCLMQSLDMERQHKRVRLDGKPGGAAVAADAGGASGGALEEECSQAAASTAQLAMWVGVRGGLELATARTPNVELCSETQLLALLQEAGLQEAAPPAASVGGGAATAGAAPAADGAAEVPGAGAARAGAGGDARLSALRQQAAEALPAWEVRRMLACRPLPDRELQAHAVLRVPPGLHAAARQAMAKGSFRRLSLALHPDKNRHDGAAEAFALLSTCSALLMP